jgi:GNAT superfamily N-acetyltransferase
MSLQIRDATSDDLVWVRSSWLDSYRQHTTHRLVRQMPAAEYFQRWRSVIAGLLEDARVIVAIHPKAPDTVCGWACFAAHGMPFRLHYVHVRERLQHKGVARELLEYAGAFGPDARPVLYSHRTTFSDSMKLPDHWLFRPYLLIGV